MNTPECACQAGGGGLAKPLASLIVGTSKSYQESSFYYFHATSSFWKLVNDLDLTGTGRFFCPWSYRAFTSCTGIGFDELVGPPGQYGTDKQIKDAWHSDHIPQIIRESTARITRRVGTIACNGKLAANWLIRAINEDALVPGSVGYLSKRHFSFGRNTVNDKIVRILPSLSANAATRPEDYLRSWSDFLNSSCHARQ